MGLKWSSNWAKMSIPECYDELGHKIKTDISQSCGLKIKSMFHRCVKCIKIPHASIKNSFYRRPLETDLIGPPFCLTENVFQIKATQYNISIEYQMLFPLMIQAIIRTNYTSKWILYFQLIKRTSRRMTLLCAKIRDFHLIKRISKRTDLVVC